MRRVLPLLIVAAQAVLSGQAVSDEYQIKAAFLYNFVKYIEWPESAPETPLKICVAGRNPLGTALDDLVRNERVNGRPLVVEVILEPDATCDMVFTPQGSAVSAYLRAAQNMPTLTVGESSNFLANGGIINFFRQNTKVRFEISQEAAERAHLKISARLLQLARPAGRSESR